MNIKKQQGRFASLVTRSGLVIAMSASLPLALHAGAVTVPDGSFNADNNVTSAGGLLVGTGSTLLDGGPWTANYTGITVGPVSLLSPTMTLHNSTSGSGFASISGIGAANAASLVDNGGSFTETLSGVNYLPNTTYTLTVNVDAGSLLGAQALANLGVGIGLMAGNTVVGSSQSSPSSLTVSLLANTAQTLQFTFTTPNTAPTGNIGITLFDLPTNTLSANVLSNVTFSNVTLSNAAATPEPSSSVLLLLGGGCCALALAGKKRRERNQADSASAF